MLLDAVMRLVEQADTEQLERLVQQRRVSRLVDPTARATRVRKWNHLRPAARVRHVMDVPHHRTQRDGPEKAIDRQASDGNDQRRTHDLELCVEPVAAARALGGRRHAVAAAGRMRAGIAARDGRDVEPVARHLLVEADALEPAEERATCTTGKWLSAAGLQLSR